MPDITTMEELHEFVKDSVTEILKDGEIDGNSKGVIAIGAAIFKVFAENQIRQSIALEQIAEYLKPQVILSHAQLWQHYKGGIYEVIEFNANREGDLVPMVVYKTFGDGGLVFVRPKAEFLEKFKPYGQETRVTSTALDTETPAT